MQNSEISWEARIAMLFSLPMAPAAFYDWEWWLVCSIGIAAIGGFWLGSRKLQHLGHRKPRRVITALLVIAYLAYLIIDRAFDQFGFKLLVALIAMLTIYFSAEAMPRKWNKKGY